MKHLGFLRVELLACELDELRPVAATAQVEVSNAGIARKQSTRVVRILKTVEAQPMEGAAELRWQQRLDFRCAEGFELAVTLLVAQTVDGQELQLHCDRTTVGYNLGGVFYLRHNNTIIGELHLQLDYIPNHQAFSYLAHAVYSDHERAVRLLEAVRLTVLEAQDLSEAQAEGIMLAIAEAQHFLADSGNCVDESFRESDDEDGAESGSALPIEKVLTTLEHQIAPILSKINSAPKTREILLRKQLALFSQHAVPVTEWTLPAFVRAALLWHLQHALVGARIMQEFSVALPEFVMLRRLFFAHDDELAGEIDALQLGELLKNMGDEYSDEQLKLILADIDPFGLGIIELPEFVRWWAADPGAPQADS